jgi:hypothetical protein
LLEVVLQGPDDALDGSNCVSPVLACERSAVEKQHRERDDDRWHYEPAHQAPGEDGEQKPHHGRSSGPSPNSWRTSGSVSASAVMEASPSVVALAGISCPMSPRT